MFNVTFVRPQPFDDLLNFHNIFFCLQVLPEKISEKLHLTEDKEI